MDRMQATPRVNPTIGSLADLLTASYSPRRTQQMQGLMKFLQVPDIAQTLDRISYGEPITTGQGMTTSLRPEAQNTLAALLGLAPIGRATEAGAVGAGRMLEPMVERAAERIYSQGGTPRQVLMDMAKGTQSRIFSGPESKTWDRDAAFRAVRMEKRGATPEEIWAATGTARGPDKMWRQEISDAKAKFNDTDAIRQQREQIQQRIGELSESVKPDRTGQRDLFPKNLTEARRPIKSEIDALRNSVSRNYGYGADSRFAGNFAPIAYDHPELYAAYPELKKFVVRQGGSSDPGLLGQQYRESIDIFNEAMMQPGGARSTATHEFQHAIQDFEKFAPGGNDSMMYQMGIRARERIPEINDELRSLATMADNPFISEQLRRESKEKYTALMREREAIRNVSGGAFKPFEAYRALGGEAESRLTQRRLNLTPEQRRAAFPFKYTGQQGYGLDTPLDELINLRKIGDQGLLGYVNP